MKIDGTVKVAVFGASGYTGAELLRLLATHPGVQITAVTSEKFVNVSVSSVFPHLATALPSLRFEAPVPEAIIHRADVIFFALPHTRSLDPVAACVAAGKRVIDLSADYRLHDPHEYEQWYQRPHSHPDLLQEAVYGLPELHRTEIPTARLVASPGCYPTAALLQLAPLVAHDLISVDSILIDAKSGVSGAGRSPALPYHFPEAHESVEAYKIRQHRHTPEIEQELRVLISRRSETNPPGPGAQRPAVRVIFTPHLVPMNRGILSTAYCRLRSPIEPAALRALYQGFYKGERFIRLLDGEASPNPRNVRGANFCDLAVFADGRSEWVVALAALDNLVKGAAGQAIQAMNLMLGFPEDLGLTAPGLYP